MGEPNMVAMFIAWHTVEFPHGTYWFGLSCTDRDRYDMFHDGKFKDPRVQKQYYAFMAGAKCMEAKDELNVLGMFKEWHTVEFSFGSYEFGLPSSGVNHHDMYTNGEFKDIIVQDQYKAFVAGVKRMEEKSNG